MKFRLVELTRVRGIAQIPLIVGLLLMAIAIPVATRLSQQEQDTRDMAAVGCKYCSNGLCLTRTTACIPELNQCVTRSDCPQPTSTNAPGLSTPTPCRPDCSCAASTPRGQTCPNKCGGICDGQKCVPSCACAGAFCIGTSCNDGCGGTCPGKKNCSEPTVAMKDCYYNICDFTNRVCKTGTRGIKYQVRITESCGHANLCNDNYDCGVPRNTITPVPPTNTLTPTATPMQPCLTSGSFSCGTRTCCSGYKSEVVFGTTCHCISTTPLPTATPINTCVGTVVGGVAGYCESTLVRCDADHYGYVLSYGCDVGKCCLPKKLDGSSCALNNSECKSGKCENYKCVSTTLTECEKITIGSNSGFCTTQSASCGQEFYPADWKSGCDGKCCIPKRLDGDSCVSGNHCLSGVCTGLKCIGSGSVTPTRIPTSGGLICESNGGNCSVPYNITCAQAGMTNGTGSCPNGNQCCKNVSSLTPTNTPTSSIRPTATRIPSQNCGTAGEYCCVPDGVTYYSSCQPGSGLTTRTSGSICRCCYPDGTKNVQSVLYCCSGNIFNNECVPKPAAEDATCGPNAECRPESGCDASMRTSISCGGTAGQKCCMLPVSEEERNEPGCYCELGDLTMCELYSGRPSRLHVLVNAQYCQNSGPTPTGFTWYPSGVPTRVPSTGPLPTAPQTTPVPTSTNAPPPGPTNPPTLPTTCSYDSLQARVQPNTTVDWNTQLTLAGGEKVNLGCMADGSGQLANNVKIVAEHSSGAKNEFNQNLVDQWTPPRPGNYTVWCKSTDSNCTGLVSSTNATLSVGSACKECPNDFHCYGPVDDRAQELGYAWFATGYVMEGWVTQVPDNYCTDYAGKAKPQWIGKGMGDANCDGQINTYDFTLWNTEFEVSRGGEVSSDSWETDFTGPQGVCDGLINTYDFSLWNRSYVQLEGGDN